MDVDRAIPGRATRRLIGVMRGALQRRPMDPHDRHLQPDSIGPASTRPVDRGIPVA